MILFAGSSDVKSEVKSTKGKSLSPSKRLGKGTGYPKGKGCAFPNSYPKFRHTERESHGRGAHTVSVSGADI